MDPDALITDEDDPAVAVVTVAELTVGVALADGRRRAARQAFLDDVIATIPVLPYDLSVAAAHARLLVATHRSGRPRGAHDLIVAATALAAGRTVVTTEVRGFTDLPDVAVRAVD